jgi:hypothetical protein
MPMLHGPLPWVPHHGRRPRRLDARRVPSPLTIGIAPVLTRHRP